MRSSSRPGAPPPVPASPRRPYRWKKIEVTAQHRPQDILTVPLAITACSGAFLEQAGISSYRELAPLVPGLVAQEQSANNRGFNLRGITSDDLDPRPPARVSVFHDGVSISRSAVSVVELHDMQCVEVVKGPQGTLFGRSAETGALSLIQNKARNAVERSLTLGGGNKGQRLASRCTFAPGGTLKLPLGDGQLPITPVWQNRSRHYFDDDNARFGGRLQQAGFGLFNLRAAWRANDTWEVAVAAENLSDKTYLIDAGNTGSLYGIPTYVAGTPRLVSASVTLRW